MISACRVRFLFECHPPLDGSVFPGPALRGLLGRRLEEVGSPESLAFLRERFRPGGDGGDAPAPWRLGFASSPRPGEGVFEVELCAFGPSARADLAAATAAFAAAGLPLRLGPGRTASLRLHGFSDLEETTLRPFEAARDSPSTALTLHLLTPLLINHGGRRLAAADLADDVRPLFHSLRLRCAELAGLRRADPRAGVPMDSPIPVAAEVGDVRLPMVFQGKSQTLVGILGSLRFEGLTPDAAGLLRVAEWTGIGRQTTFGAGTALVEGEADMDGRDIGECGA